MYKPPKSTSVIQENMVWVNFLMIKISWLYNFITKTDVCFNLFLPKTLSLHNGEFEVLDDFS